jgi:hypothetical protein
MSIFDEMQSAYEGNGDRKLLAELGLRTHGFGRDWTDIGTVIHREAEETDHGLRPATEVKVEVSALPAQFWRFTILRPREEIEDLEEEDENGRDWRCVYTPRQVIQFSTGSGSFSKYWEVAKLIAEHMIGIDHLDSEKENLHKS